MNHFFDEWSIYGEILERNYMLHDEIYRDVHRLLADRHGDRPIAILDLGCGSARHLAQTLKECSVSRYVGYDLSDVALTHASLNLASLGCPVELHQGDLLRGLTERSEKFDLIFTGFALHHLSSTKKAVFFQLAYQLLSDDGTLLVIDTMRDEGEQRELYLERYGAWLRSKCKTLSPAALDLLCAHIRDNDFPETAAALGAMARRAGFGDPLEISRFGWHHTWCLRRAAPGFHIG